MLKKEIIEVFGGTANFETTFPKALAPTTFFLFKVKCRPIEAYLNAPVESFVALWQDGHPIR